MRRFAGCCRFLWNKALALEKDPSLTQRYARLEDSSLKNSASLVGDFLTDSAQPDGDNNKSR